MPLCFVYMLIIKLKTESQTINRKPHCKVTKLKSKFYFFLGKLNRALNNPGQGATLLDWPKSIYKINYSDLSI